MLVAGWPASGKSTLAAALAAELGLPLLAKDEIKEALMDGLGRPVTVTESQRLGRAAVLAMLRVAHRCPAAVLDSTWFDYALPLVATLPGRIVEVHCIVPVPLARARYRARAGARHAGHLDADRSEEELWGSPSRPASARSWRSTPPARSTWPGSPRHWPGHRLSWSRASPLHRSRRTLAQGRRPEQGHGPGGTVPLRRWRGRSQAAAGCRPAG